MKQLFPAAVAVFLVLLTAPFPAQSATSDTVDDSVIAATIKAGLLDTKDTSGTRINVDSNQGVVQLSGTKLDDSLVTGRVKAALMDAADVKSLHINVETHNGVTQLAGFVATAAMKDKAEKITAGIDGVKSVDNVLVVKPR